MSESTDPSPTRTATAGTREWAGLAVLGLASLLVSIDVFVLLLALPSLSRDLDASATEQLWIMDIYGFLLVGFMLTAGTLGDRIGRRTLLLLGGAGFAAASVVAAFSTSPEMLIAARALLGIAGATLAPSTLGLISTMFRDARQRSVAIGLWMIGFMGGAAAGPVVGGFMLEHFWWGSVFLLGVPAMVLLLVLGPILLPEERDPAAGRVDLTSVALSLAAILPAVFGLKEFATHGWAATSGLAVVVGVAFGWVFVRRQQRLDDPLVDLSLFRNRAFTTVVISMMLVTVIGSLMFFTAQFLQLVAGLTPLQAGFAMLPAALAAIVSFGGAPILAQHIRPVFAISGGMLVAAAGCFLYTLADADGGLVAIIAGLAVMNLGCGPLVTLGTGIVVGSVPSAKAGSAAAMSETSAEFGYAIGLAVVGSLGALVYRTQLSIAPDVPDDLADGARESLAGAATSAAQLGPDGAALLDSAREAFTTSVHVVGWVAAAIALLVAVVDAVYFRHLPPIVSETDAAASPPDHAADVEDWVCEGHAEA
ncbi:MULTISPECIES: MFS transporter [Rhodococcus]|uniref:Putative transporter n=1 Tax=Rhodococcus wratislaviensis NBRC 100605 TaxID=1219028 RepID=X0Q0P4_RHOWR|nr:MULTISPECIES: MFS transporter [Rhodococcus]GAF44407.1 putative transporter [Rhodococcus wratislaviensis NBRC 100605]